VLRHHPRGTRHPGAVSSRPGGGRTHVNGYVLIFVGPDHPMANGSGYVLEHRVIMADHIGRMLTAEEVVHHKMEIEGGSGRRDDNRIENLVLFSSTGEHSRHHKLIAPFCSNGHPRTEANTHITSAGKRKCRDCMRATQERANTARRRVETESALARSA
jgi:hypothetical protein